MGIWTRGYHVSAVDRDEEKIGKYIHHQEEEGKKLDKLSLF